jgi:uroporphyrinogen-III synthase
MSRFNGARVALLEARMSREMADLVRRYGGEPHCTPAVREAPLPSAVKVRSFIEVLTEGRLAAVVFLTGAGATALFTEADRQGQLPHVLAALRRTATVCRGPKPSAVLRRHGVPVALTACEPFTTAELVDVMNPVDLDGRGVGLVHYGERDGTLVDALTARGAQMHELCLYEWLLPEDCEPLKALVRRLITGEFDAVAFTSQVQCRHLFRIAREMGEADALRGALKSGVVVAAVGPVCAGALRELGITPQVVPANPKMAPMVAALAAYFESAPIVNEEP